MWRMLSSCWCNTHRSQQLRSRYAHWAGALWTPHAPEQSLIVPVNPGLSTRGAPTFSARSSERKGWRKQKNRSQQHCPPSACTALGTAAAPHSVQGKEAAGERPRGCCPAHPMLPAKVHRSSQRAAPDRHLCAPTEHQEVPILFRLVIDTQLWFSWINQDTHLSVYAFRCDTWCSMKCPRTKLPLTFIWAHWSMSDVPQKQIYCLAE